MKTVIGMGQQPRLDVSPGFCRHDPALAPRRICVFRALPLGDMVCAGPALRALRRRYPEARITLVGLPSARDFVKRMGDCVDDLAAFPGWPGLPGAPLHLSALPGFVQDMRTRRFDLAVQLHGSGALTNAVVRSFGARVLAAHCPGDGRPWTEREAYWPYPEHLHEVHRNLHLVARLGANVDDDRVSFPLLESDEAELKRRRPDLAALPAGRYVCLHAGARDKVKRWPIERFAEVGDGLAARGWRVVLTGNAAEAQLVARLALRMHQPAVPAACNLSVGALAMLLSRATLLISNDTDVAHVAAGLGLPSVVVFYATEPRRWAPLDQTRHKAIRACEPVASSQVLDAALGLLASA